MRSVKSGQDLSGLAYKSDRSKTFFEPLKKFTNEHLAKLETGTLKSPLASVSGGAPDGNTMKAWKECVHHLCGRTIARRWKQGLGPGTNAGDEFVSEASPQVIMFLATDPRAVALPGSVLDSSSAMPASFPCELAQLREVSCQQ